MPARRWRPGRELPLVVDAGALAEVLLPTDRGRKLAPTLRHAPRGMHAPALLDAEVTSAIRRIEHGGEISTSKAEAALFDLAGVALIRYPIRPLLTRAWELRNNFTIYDGLYVALGEALDAALLTLDGRLVRAIRKHTAVALHAAVE